jgi:hypothetical protein
LRRRRGCGLIGRLLPSVLSVDGKRQEKPDCEKPDPQTRASRIRREPAICLSPLSDPGHQPPAKRSAVATPHRQIGWGPWRK